MQLQLTVLTLNVWGIPFVSRNREIRINAICSELSSGKYDIVSLQEVWSEADYQTLKEKTSAVLPYEHYFYSGVIGAGLLVLSRYPIVGTLFHAWSVNGYFHRIQHADWFGGKGVGLCKILAGDKIVHLYNAHLHAEYDNENDEYKTHRVIQAFDTAQFIEETRGNSVLQILAGDLNTQPQDISYKVLLYTSKMLDCCSSDAIATNECQRNSYTSKSVLKKNDIGIRIDHIFIRSGDMFKTVIQEYALPFPERVPGQKFSFSDHEAVVVKLKLSSKDYDTEADTGTVCAEVETTEVCSNGHVFNSLIETEAGNQNHCHSNVPEASNEAEASLRISVLQESIALCDSSMQKLKMDRIIYYSIALFISLLLLALAEYTVPSGFRILYLLFKFVFFGIVLFCTFMGSIWNYMERHGVLSGKISMEIMLRSIEKFELNLNNVI